MDDEEILLLKECLICSGLCNMRGFVASSVVDLWGSEITADTNDSPGHSPIRKAENDTKVAADLVLIYSFCPTKTNTDVSISQGSV